MIKTAEPASIRQLLEQATRLLSTDSAPLDAEVLLAHALGQARSYLRAWPEKFPTADQQETFQRLLQARLQGEPVAYLTGQREFWSLPLAVTPATLIPRAETETLVALPLPTWVPAVVPLHWQLRMSDQAVSCWQQMFQQPRLRQPWPTRNNSGLVILNSSAVTGVRHWKTVNLMSLSATRPI